MGVHLREHGEARGVLQVPRRRNRAVFVESAVYVDPGRKFAKNTLRIIDGDLACACSGMPPTSILKHQRSNIGIGGTIKDRLAGCKNDVLLSESPKHMDADIRLWEKRIDQKTIAGVYKLLSA